MQTLKETNHEMKTKRYTFSLVFGKLMMMLKNPVFREELKSSTIFKLLSFMNTVRSSDKFSYQHQHQQQDFE